PGKQRCLLPTRPCSHLDDDAAVVVWVARYEEATELDLEQVTVLVQPFELFMSHGAHLFVGVGSKLLGGCLFCLQPSDLAKGAHHRLEPRQLSPQGRERGRIGCVLGAGQLPRELVVALLELTQAVKHGRTAAPAREFWLDSRRPRHPRRGRTPARRC